MRAHVSSSPGYVPEEKIAELFRGASVAVMPYSSATGASGVAHLACAYGVPIISSDIADFAHMAEEEDMAIEFYKNGDSSALAEKIVDLLNSPERQREMAVHNFSAALRMTMPSVISEYVSHFGVAHQTRELRPVRWFRRLPLWITRSFLGRLVLRGMMRGNYRLRSSQARSGSLNGARLFNANRHGGRGHLGASGSPTNGDGVVRTALDLPGSGAHPGTRTEKHGSTNNKQSHQPLDKALPFYLPNANEAHHAEREQARVEESLLMLPVLESGGNGSGGNGKHEVLTFPELAITGEEKAQFIPTGRPEHENAIGVSTLPEVEVTVIAVLAKVPRLIFNAAGAA